MAYEIWNKHYWGSNFSSPLETTVTYDMSLIKAEDLSKYKYREATIVVIEKNSPAPAKLRALFVNGKMIPPVNCKHCSGYGDEDCPCKGAGWKLSYD